MRLTESTIEVHRADIDGLMLVPKVDTDGSRADTLYDEFRTALPMLRLSIMQLVAA